MKKISNQFVVNTVEDGESAPYYFQEWFAWSNDATTASVTTEPTIDGVWATSIPAQGSYAYLWRKSIRNVWDANSRTYTQETAQYFRMSGENGTSINVKGTINYAYNNSGGFPPPSSSITGYKAVAKEDNRIWICQQVAQNAYDWVPNGGTASDGFSYTIVQGNFNGNYQSTSNLTGHLVMWSTEAEDWVDLGLFKGESGVTYYTHIAWATSVTLSQSELPIPSGQTNRPNALAANISGFSITPLSGVSYAWMGYLIDTNSSDSQTKQNYTWQRNKGEKGDKGDDAQYIYLKGTALNKEGSEPKVPCAVSVNGGNNLATTDRGLNLVTLNRTTLALAERINYDTYGEAVGEAGKTGITDLVTKLNSISNDVFVCLVSYDAIGWNSTLISVLQDFGMSELQYTASWRYPFMFIGYKGLGYGNGITRMRDAVEHSSEAVEMSVYIANGALTMKDGERGEMGRFFYFGGVFNSADATQTFIVNDAQAPYFEHTENGQKRYHVFNYDTNGTYTMAQMWAVSDNWNNKPWESMTNDFKYIITEALFANFAKLGSFVISGDWMLSTNGKINDTNYNDGAMYNGAPAYTWFDPDYPNVDHTKTVTIGGQQVTVHNFIPNFCVDGLTGETYQQNAHIKGDIEATSGSFAGQLKGVNGTFTHLKAAGDKVEITTTPSGWGGYDWYGFSTTTNGTYNGDLATIGARITNTYDYGRLVLVKRNKQGSQQQIIILDSGDGTITAPIMKPATLAPTNLVAIIHEDDGAYSLPANPLNGQMIFLNGVTANAQVYANGHAIGNGANGGNVVGPTGTWTIGLHNAMLVFTTVYMKWLSLYSS